MRNKQASMLALGPRITETCPLGRIRAAGAEWSLLISCRKRLRPRPRWRPLYAAGCRRGRTPNAPQDWYASGLVQRITQAPPLRLTNLQASTGLPFLCASSPSTLVPLALAPVDNGSLLWADLALPFTGLALLGLAAFGSVIGLATSAMPSSLVGLGGTGCDSCRSCAGDSLEKVTPSSRDPAPDGSVVTTPSGGPSSFQASAASSSSLSLSSPAMIASAIRPAF